MSFLWLIILLSVSLALGAGALFLWRFMLNGTPRGQVSTPEPNSSRYQESGIFDVAISLGFRCETAHQLNEHGYRKEAYPFDWLETPFEALCALLEHNFVGFLEREDLWRVGWFPNSVEGDSYVTNSLGVNFYHDFPISESFLSGYEEVREKYDRRIARLYETLESGERVVLVRHLMLREEARQLCDVVRRRFPQLDFLVVAINHGSENAIDWGLDRVRNFSVPRVDGWYGDTAAYGELFESLNITRAIEPEFVEHTFPRAASG